MIEITRYPEARRIVCLQASFENHNRDYGLQHNLGKQTRGPSDSMHAYRVLAGLGGSAS